MRNSVNTAAHGPHHPSPAMNLPESHRRRGRSLTSEVVTSLSRRIESGEFPTGTKLPSETEIMQQEGVSRTVVREAISRLQAARLVETRHGIGTFVLDKPVTNSLQLDTGNLLTLLDVMAVLEFRISIESEAAGLAAARRTDRHLADMRQALQAFERSVEEHGPGNAVEADIAFHLQIANATGNRYFFDILSQLGNTIIPRVRVNSAALAAADQQAYLQRVNQEHQFILSAIDRKDPEAARAAMRTHLTNSRERLRHAHEQAAAAGTNPRA
ncbi:MAG: HTH-type transcriptional regulator LutR [Paracidovorax wautersii]|uniref:HTH-type transcriptional regulator LutR n=1 Tax=Paracidovorax wautersii TaxID=1177982 RepID=A0A7V8FP68_9BURK|nr:MAG: HTH-type transcriptional regulator LutR [Paracidovorax wautersii]